MCFFFNDTATTEIYTLSLHDALPISLLDSYLEWMKRYQHTAAGTLEVRAQSLTRFLRWLGPEATPEGLSTLNPAGVEGFFLSHAQDAGRRSEEHTSELQSHSFISYAVFCLKKKNKKTKPL